MEGICARMNREREILERVWASRMRLEEEQGAAHVAMQRQEANLRGQRAHQEAAAAVMQAAARRRIVARRVAAARRLRAREAQEQERWQQRMARREAAAALAAVSESSGAGCAVGEAGKPCRGGKGAAGQRQAVAV